jgi:Alginate lyase
MKKAQRITSNRWLRMLAASPATSPLVTGPKCGSSLLEVASRHWPSRCVLSSVRSQCIKRRHDDGLSRTNESATMKHILLLILTSGLCCVGQGQEASPQYFGVSPGQLAKVRARLAAGDKTLAPALKTLTDEADEALQLPPPSVMQKSKTPPSGDMHDYLSIAPYFWPDPARSNGLPYVRHDGKVNPESRNSASDHVRVGLMANTVETLALAYYLTGKDAYAQQAAKFLRVWFLEPATRMNPNLKYAQGVPGVNEGRGTGIIEGRGIAQTADATGLLAGSAAWPKADEEALKAWLSTYLNWLLTSTNGLHEAAARNNHGTFYDVQAMRLALVLGKADLAKRMAEAAKQKRIAVQIQPDGQQPLELERTASLSYSRLNLEALFLLATLAEHAGVDLWHYETADGRSLRQALDYLLPYMDTPPREWPREQIKKFDRTEFAPLLRQAAFAYHEPKYEAILAKTPSVSRKRLQLLFPQAPSTTLNQVPQSK